MDEAAIETEIQTKGLNAPRLTPALIDAAILGEVYYVPTGTTMTICVLTLKNGFQVTGESAAASPENFDKEIGQKIARENARNKIWALEGYLLKQRLHEARGELIGGTAESHAVYKFAGWLTSRDEAITSSGHDDAAPMAHAVAEYLALQATTNT